MASAARDVLAFYPKLFYFNPMVAPRDVVVRGQHIRLAEPLCCVLWLLETLALDMGKPYCSQDELEDLVAWWQPPSPNRNAPYNFSRDIGKLIKRGFVRSERDPGDQRKNHLRLTDSGQVLLDIVKQDRLEVIEIFLKRVPRTVKMGLVPALRQTADLTWKTMRKEARAAAARRGS